MSLLARVIGTYLRTYHRHSVELDAPFPREPAVVVGNHGFGGIVDLNVMAMIRVLDEHQDRPVTFLVHQIAWTLGAGRLVEAHGGRPASRAAATDALARGDMVAVFPGGDLDAGKPWHRRHSVSFAGRTGFAATALEHGVPIVPVVTVGAGESLLVIDDGRKLAARLALAHRLRLKALPVTVSIPWGVNVGLVGLLPYFPLPSKLSTAVLASITPRTSETAAELAGRVETAMQTRATALVAGRTPLLG